MVLYDIARSLEAGCHVESIWLRTTGADTHGAAAIAINFDSLGQTVRPIIVHTMLYDILMQLYTITHYYVLMQT